MTVLGIDTSGEACAVAVARDGAIVALRRSQEPRRHSELLHAFIEQCLAGTGGRLQPTAVAVAAGPGSFTGLRVGFSAAKGICLALSIPLVTVPTFEAWAAAAAAAGLLADGGRALCLMPSGRSAAYAGVVRRQGDSVAEERAPEAVGTSEVARIAAEAAPSLILAEDPALVARWTAGAALPPVARADDEGRSPAAAVALLGGRMLRRGQTADVRFAEPSYFRDLSTTLRNA